VEEVIAAYDGFCRRLETWSGKGDLDVRDLRAGKARRVGVRVLAGRGGRLYVKGTVAVVTALEIVADGRRFWFRVPSKKTVWTGSAEAGVDEGAEGEQAPYYALRPADVVEALLPEPLAGEDAAAEPGRVVVMDADRDAFALTEAFPAGGRGPARRRVVLDRETLLPRAVRSYDQSGSLLREARYSDWRSGQARRILLSRPREGYEAEFVLDEVEVNPTLPEKAFAERKAEGYRVVEVGPR
jgi:hypothetical protein